MSRYFRGAELLDLGNPAPYDTLSGAVTVHCFARIDERDASYSQNSLISKWGSGTRSFLMDVQIPAGTLSFNILSGLTGYGVGMSGVNHGRWQSYGGVHHVSPSPTIQPFIDGVGGPIAAAGSMASSTHNLIIGGRGDSATVQCYMDGSIVHPAIWNIGLTGPEMQALARGVSPLNIRPQNLISYWTFEEPGSVLDLSRLYQNDFTTVTGVSVSDKPLYSRSPIPLRALASVGFTDTGTVQLSLTPSSTEVFAGVDTATAPLALTPSGVEGGFADLATALLTLTPSAADEFGIYDAATAQVTLTPSAPDTAQYVDQATRTLVLTPSGVDTAQFVDASTISLSFTIEGHDCLYRLTPDFDIESSQKWPTVSNSKYYLEPEAATRWYLSYSGKALNVPDC